MALLTLGSSSLMIFTSSTIVPQLLIKSLICHIISTGMLIGSILMPPIPKLQQFLLIMTHFLVFTIDLMVLCESKET